MSSSTRTTVSRRRSIHPDGQKTRGYRWQETHPQPPQTPHPPPLNPLSPCSLDSHPPSFQPPPSVDSDDCSFTTTVALLHRAWLSIPRWRTLGFEGLEENVATEGVERGSVWT
ncbi:hypothetical protein FA13DRAFT_1741438 [Coprinellus micaceus]|uniref:Uncharacterized protein n=1 Tax=Coprinellus micaceus TaxID=71717 RepID=A0A4Y7SJ51_COPMI|nr:hypothetical protein FA13DRAFT_1741438 [Coprinellus micaceus]